MILECIYVLCIEDNPADFKLLAKKMESPSEYGKIILKHSSTLSEARSLLESGKDKPHLILLDLSLPDANNMEGVAFIKKNYPYLPIVVLTGNTDTAVGVEAIRAGVQDYLVKGEYSADLLHKTCRYAIERKHIETELQKTVEALQAEKKIVALQNQQINQFVSVLVSDLKSPLTSILSLTELLLQDKQRLNATQLNYLTQIHYSSDSMLDNVLSIIETTQMQEGNMTVHLLWENPYHTINAAIDKYIVEAISRNIMIDVKYKKDLPKVHFDKRLLHNVLSSLLEVSIAYTHKASRITVSAEQDANHLIKFVIFNNGFVLSPQELEHLFDDTIPSEAQQGLKLSIAKKMINLMDGNIEVESSSKGTTFRIDLRMKS